MLTIGLRRPAVSLFMNRMSVPARQYSAGVVAEARTLSWNDFFKLRARRRRIGAVCSVVTTLAGTAAGFAYFGNIPIDATQKLLGLDLIWFLGGAIASCGFFGYLAGPTLGSQAFKLSLGRRSAEFARMDSQFLRRIRVNRPDPAKQSYVNPLTDYYGEKIGSLHDYRRWLRDSHLFQRKSQKFL